MFRLLSEICKSMASTKLVISSLITILLTLAAVSTAAPGTTRNLQSVFIGRCWSFQTVAEQTPELLHDPVRNCSLLWKTFTEAFLYKDPCQVKEDDFTNYFKMAGSGKYLKDKSLFWSGTNRVAHRLSFLHEKYVTLEDTLPGFLLNKLQFCGGKKGLNYTACPPWNRCYGSHVMESYWKHASEQFARHASGIAYVLVNGSRGNSPAYSKYSFFASKELPNMNTSLIKELRVLVVKQPSHVQRESCSKGSIPMLLADSRKRGIKTTCNEEPRIVLKVLCLNYPFAEECIRRCDDESSKLKTMYAVVSFLAIITVILLAICMYILILKKKQKQNSGKSKDDIKSMSLLTKENNNPEDA